MHPEYGKGLPSGERNDSGSVPLIGSAGVLGHHDVPLVDGPVVIVGRKGNAGAVHLSTEPCWPIDTTYFLRVPPALDPTFVALQISIAGLGALDSSTAIPSLRRPDLEKAVLVVPPLAEQRRIVSAMEEQFSRLDAADGSLRAATHRISAIRRAVTRDAFAGQWPERPLVELTPQDRPICYGILMPKEHVEHGVLYVRVRDFPVDKIEVSGLRRTTKEIAAKYHRSTLRSGDVLVSIRGTFGRVATVPDELAGANITQDTARVSPGVEIEGGYLAAFLRSEPAQRYFQRVARGVAVKGVNIGDLRQLPVPLPSHIEQRRIVSKIDQQISLIDSLRHAVESAQKRSAAVRRSILERAFRGDLVPQDPEDEPASVLLERIGAERAAAPKSTRRKRVMT